MILGEEDLGYPDHMETDLKQENIERLDTGDMDT